MTTSRFLRMAQTVSPATPTFNDVPPSYWAYTYIETAFTHNVIGGYDCLRLTPTPLHSDEDMTRLVAALQDVWQTLDLGSRAAAE